VILSRALSGIYEIRNKINNHKYIGSSVNIKSRFNKHKNQLKRNRHHNIYLQRAWNKYGKENFEFIILEECEPIKNIILVIEQKYLDLKPEYNICLIAGNTQGVSHAGTTTWNIERRKPVLMLDLENNFIMEFNSIRQASIYVGGINCKSDIKRVLRNIHPTAYGYTWKFKV
jgi:hypothetical protein